MNRQYHFVIEIDFEQVQYFILYESKEWLLYDALPLMTTRTKRQIVAVAQEDNICFLYFNIF